MTEGLTFVDLMPNFEGPMSLQRLLDGKGLSHPLHTANVGSQKGNTGNTEAVPGKKLFFDQKPGVCSCVQSQVLVM